MLNSTMWILFIAAHLGAKDPYNAYAFKIGPMASEAQCWRMGKRWHVNEWAWFGLMRVQHRDRWSFMYSCRPVDPAIDMHGVDPIPFEWLAAEASRAD